MPRCPRPALGQEFRGKFHGESTVQDAGAAGELVVVQGAAIRRTATREHGDDRYRRRKNYGVDMTGIKAILYRVWNSETDSKECTHDRDRVYNMRRGSLIESTQIWQ